MTAASVLDQTIVVPWSWYIKIRIEIPGSCTRYKNNTGLKKIPGTSYLFCYQYLFSSSGEKQNTHTLLHVRRIHTLRVLYCIRNPALASVYVIRLSLGKLLLNQLQVVQRTNSPQSP